MKQRTMRQIILRKLGAHIAMLCGATAAGLLLLLAVYMLPVKPMEEHIRQSLPMIEREFEAGYLLEDFPGSFMGGVYGLSDVGTCRLSVGRAFRAGTGFVHVSRGKQ